VRDVWGGTGSGLVVVLVYSKIFFACRGRCDLRIVEKKSLYIE
jgi:hypothetical protein